MLKIAVDDRDVPRRSREDALNASRAQPTPADPTNATHTPIIAAEVPQVFGGAVCGVVVDEHRFPVHPSEQSIEPLDQRTDIVVASRYLALGAADGLSGRRRLLSRAGARLARVLLQSDITDPVSGFFMMRSEVMDNATVRLSGVGTKILIDILASAPGPLSVTELPYRFRGRQSGSSKLDWFTVLNIWRCSPRR